MGTQPLRQDQQQNLADDLLARAVRAGAERADCVLIESVDVSTSCRMGKQEELERSESVAVGLRVWVGQKAAIASASDFATASLDELASRAVSMARVATDDPYSGLAAEELWARDIPDLDLYDPREPSAETLLDMAKAAEDAALTIKGITNSEGADAYYGTHCVTLAHSGGWRGSYLSSDLSLSVCVIAGKGDGMERDYEYAMAAHLEDLPSPETIGIAAAERTVRRLKPRKIATRQIPVLFEPRVGKGLIGAFAGAISGAAVARGSTYLKSKMGEQLFAPGLRLIDDPLIKRGQGSHPFDGEGVRVQKRAIVEDGRLLTWLLDLRSAAQLGLTTTGHASRGLASPPSPSSSNFYMEAGSLSPAELMKDITLGLYVTDTFGSGVNNVTGDYSQGASGFLIENGELTVPVAEITIAGHMLEAYKRLTPANDLEFKYATNVPTLRVDGLTVAGN